MAFWYSGQDRMQTAYNVSMFLEQNWEIKKDLIVPLSLNQILLIRVKWGK
jgi:hypothetical protein